MSFFILNNKRERPHQQLYSLDTELSGVPIYDYDDKQKARASNTDFQEMTTGSLALIFGKNLKVNKIFRITGTKKKPAPDLGGQEVFVVYGRYVESLDTVILLAQTTCLIPNWIRSTTLEEACS